MSAKTKLEMIEKRIREDLVPFCDPGTLLDLTRQGQVFAARWTQRRQLREAEFVIEEPYNLLVRRSDGSVVAYKSFFAGEDMADIMGIAKTTLGLHRITGYVETMATAPDLGIDDSNSVPATTLLRDVALGGDLERQDGTNFVMVTGEAGAGKTWALKEMVRRQAQDYCDGKTTCVFLYIDAQGRALAKFHEALATELNELRVVLPYHAVAPMVRLGLIVPVVDGFDELIGVGGYDDAFSSISIFVDDLQGAGAIIASARSTYYEQEFLVRANRSSEAARLSWKLTPVQVSAWTDVQRAEFVSRICLERGADPESVRIELSRIFSGPNEELRSKPLFFAKTAEFVATGGTVEGEGSLTAQLIDAFITRELTEKLLDRNNKPILTQAELWSLSADMAEEMWNQGSRELDRVTVKDIAESALLDIALGPSESSIVIERMPSMAFLKTGDVEKSVAFEHEIFFDYFLARRFSQRLNERGPTTVVMLGRSAMPESLSEEIARCLVERQVNPVEITGVLSSAARSNSPKQAQVRENCGRIVGAVFGRYGRIENAETKFEIGQLVFPGSDFSGVTIADAMFKSCEFRRVGLAATTFRNCSFPGCVFEAPMVSSETSFVESEFGGDVNLAGLRVADSGGEIRTLYNPVEVRAALRVIGAIQDEDEQAAASLRKIDSLVIRLIDRISKSFAKCNPVRFEDDQNATIAADPNWPEVRKLALDSGIVRTEIRGAHGPRREFLRRTVRFEDVLAGLSRDAVVPDSVRTFWDSIETVFPAS